LNEARTQIKSTDLGMARLRLGTTHWLMQMTTITAIASGIKTVFFVAVFFTLDTSKQYIV